jgi:hypothetical protein
MLQLLELVRAMAPREVVSKMASRGDSDEQQKRLDRDQGVANLGGCSACAPTQAFPSSRVTPGRGRG